MSKKLTVVTTTINEPTKATLKFCALASANDWLFVVVGDKKTPHHRYRQLEERYGSLVYLDPKKQEGLFPELSELTGWNKIQRRNLGFVYAWHLGAEVIATVDDDNIPYDDWGSHVLVGQEIEYNCWEAETGIFDPLSATNCSYIWHRGYPIQLLDQRLKVKPDGRKAKKVLVQADLWDGDPDIDAMARLIWQPMVKFGVESPFGSEQIAPFNSQNTFLHRSVISKYAVLPYIGRMDDIWGGYILQHFFPNSVIYNRATVYQDRNVQDLVTNLENEIIGYRQTLDLIRAKGDFEKVLPKKALAFWHCYQRQFNDSEIHQKVLAHSKK